MAELKSSPRNHLEKPRSQQGSGLFSFGTPRGQHAELTREQSEPPSVQKSATPADFHKPNTVRFARRGEARMAELKSGPRNQNSVASDRKIRGHRRFRGSLSPVRIIIRKNAVILSV
jgi:hypothetical protein